VDGTQVTISELEGCRVFANEAGRVAMMNVVGDYIDWKVYQEGDPDVKTTAKIQDDRIVFESEDVSGNVSENWQTPIKMENKITSSNYVTKAVMEPDIIAEYLPTSEGKKTYNIAEDDVMSLKSLSKTYQIQSHVDADYYGNDYYYACDEKLKKNIKDYAGESKIKDLKVKSYERKGKERVGFIAQDVAEVFPNSVKVDEEGNMGMTNTEILAHAVKRIQEQDERINQLEALIVP